MHGANAPPPRIPEGRVDPAKPDLQRPAALRIPSPSPSSPRHPEFDPGCGSTLPTLCAQICKATGMGARASRPQSLGQGQESRSWESKPALLRSGNQEAETLGANFSPGRGGRCSRWLGRGAGLPGAAASAMNRQRCVDGQRCSRGGAVVTGTLYAENRGLQRRWLSTGSPGPMARLAHAVRSPRQPASQRATATVPCSKARLFCPFAKFLSRRGTVLELSLVLPRPLLAL